MRYCLAAVLAVIGWGGIACAQTATVTKNEDEAVRNYYQQVAYADCSSGNACIVTFPQVTGSYRTVVTHVACDFSIADPGKVVWAQLESQPANLWTPLQVFAYTDVNAYTEYGINTNVYMFFTHLQHPAISLGWTGAVPANMKCLLTGYSVNLLN